MMRYLSQSLLILFAGFATSLPAEQIDPADSISFARQIAPILRRNCIACHRDQQSEGGLSLESQAALQRGGDSGALFVASLVEDSLLFQRVNSADEAMPPPDNSVGAKPLTDLEREWIKRWISEGAIIDSFAEESSIDWQPIPETLLSSYALAVAPDDQFIALAHANRVDLIDANSGVKSASLVDESLTSHSAADVDLIQSIAIAPMGDRIATGGFRTVRIWKRAATTLELPPQLKRAAGPIAFNPDRSAVAIVTAIDDVEIWTIDSNRLQCTLPNAGPVSQIIWHHDSQVLVSHSSGDLRICDPQMGAEIGVLALDHVSNQIDQSADGRRIVSLGSDGQVRLFIDQQLQTLQSLAAITDASSVAFGPADGLMVGRSSGSVKCVDIAGDRALYELTHGSPVRSVKAGHMGNCIATASSDGQTKLWSVADGSLLQTCSGDAFAKLRLAALQADVSREQSWIQSLQSKTAELSKTLENEDAALAKVNEAKQKAVDALAEQTKQRDQTLTQIEVTEKMIVDTKTAIETVTQSALQTEATIAKNIAQIQSLSSEIQPLEKQYTDALSSQQSAQAAVEEAVKKLEIAKQVAEQIAQQVSEKKSALVAVEKDNLQAAEQLAAHKATVAKAMNDLSGSESGLGKQRESLAAVEKQVAAKQADLAERDQALVTSQKTRDQAANQIPLHQDRIRVRNNRLSEFTQRHGDMEQLRDQSAPVCSVVFNSDDTSIFVVDTSGRTRQFQVGDGRLINQWHYDSNAALASGSLASGSLASGSLASSTGFVDLDGNLLILSSPTTLPLGIDLQMKWELEQTIGGPMSDLIADRVTALDFRHDGQSLAIGSGIPSRSGQILIVSTATGQVLRNYDQVHSDSVLGARFSPDDRVLATCAADKTIRLLDMQTDQIIGALDGHTHHVLSVAWSRDARSIASGGADGTIKIWDAETGQQTRTIGNLRDEITSVAFLGDSTRIVSSSADGQVRVHESSNGSQLHAARAASDFLFAHGINRAGTKVFSAGQTGTLHVWETEGMKPVGQW